MLLGSEVDTGTGSSSVVWLQKTSPSSNNDDDWPQFRGPQGQGISSARNLPVVWNKDKNLLWKAELPGAGSSSPIVVGGRVFVTCYSGYGVPGQQGGDINQLRRHLICFDARSGNIRWRKDIPARLPESPSVREHGYAASTPACDGQRVYVFFGKSGVFAFDLDGKHLWTADVGDRHHGWGSAASPVVHRDLVLVNACVESETLLALDKRTGRVVWRVPGIKESWNTPLVTTDGQGKAELVVAIAGRLLAFDPESGTPLWHCDTDIKWYMVPSPVAEEGVVYSLGGRSGVAGLAVRTGGRGDVTRTRRLWTSNKGSNVSSPVVYRGHLFWVHESLGIAYCAEAKTGRILYEERLPGAGQLYASAVLADGKLYYVSRTGRTFVVKAGQQCELLAVNDLSDRSTFDASPAVSGNRIYVRSYRYLYCIGEGK